MKATCVISVFTVLSFKYALRRKLFNMELSCGGIASQPEERWGAKVITSFCEPSVSRRKTWYSVIHEMESGY
jgi:hypothetical protein